MYLLLYLEILSKMKKKESHRLEEYAMRWLSTDAGTRVQIKTGAIQTLGSPDTSVGTVAAQVIAAISVIELPKGQWPELIPSLLTQMTTSKTPTMKQMALQAIGFICESNAVCFYSFFYK